MGSAPTSPTHPRPSVVGPNQPPPLQRVLPSKVTPATPVGGPPRQQSIPPIFTRQGSQVSGLPRLSLVRGGGEGRGGGGRGGGQGRGKRGKGRIGGGGCSLHHWFLCYSLLPPQPSPPNAARFTLQPVSRPDPVTEDRQEEEEGEEEEEEESNR